MNAAEFAAELIKFDSTWYLSNRDVSDYVERTLRALDFDTERIEYDDAGVTKVSVVGRKGSGPGGLAYFGHTDVVTSDDWSIREHGPFDPVIRDGRLYGRGSTDMKGSIACMLAAVTSLRGEPLRHPVYVSCSCDEEVSHRGAVEITERSRFYREAVEGKAVGIVGEPTSLQVVYAHKGGCRITATSRGKAAHSSTREGLNANWAMIPFLAEMKSIREETETDRTWMDDEFDPPTICFNLGINDHTKAVNITAPQSVCTIGFRPMPATDVERVIGRSRRCALELGIDFQVENNHPAFRRDPASDFVQSVLRMTGNREPRTVAFGSEASNFTEMENLIVLGPGDIAQAHKSDEWISLDQLDAGERTYRKLIESFCR